MDNLIVGGKVVVVNGMIFTERMPEATEQVLHSQVVRLLRT